VFVAEVTGIVMMGIKALAWDTIKCPTRSYACSGFMQLMASFNMINGKSRAAPRAGGPDIRNSSS
jgi:hypothetical protein